MEIVDIYCVCKKYSGIYKEKDGQWEYIYCKACNKIKSALGKDVIKAK